MKGRDYTLHLKQTLFLGSCKKKFGMPCMKIRVVLCSGRLIVSSNSSKEYERCAGWQSKQRRDTAIPDLRRIGILRKPLFI
jgi:hypothetical protein